MSFLENIGKNITVGDVKIKNTLENWIESFLYSCSNSNVEKNNTGFHLLRLSSKKPLWLIEQSTNVLEQIRQTHCLMLPVCSENQVGF